MGHWARGIGHWALGIGEEKARWFGDAGMQGFARWRALAATSRGARCVVPDAFASTQPQELEVALLQRDPELGEADALGGVAGEADHVLVLAGGLEDDG